MTKRHRGMLYAAGALIVLAAPPGIWLLSGFDPAPRSEPSPVVPAAHVVQAPAHPGRNLVKLAEQDPMALVHLGRHWYEKNVKGYQCLFTKQEFVDGKLSEEQEIEVRYRENPHAVYMIWQKNADGARRALFKDDPEYVDKRGRKLARIEPNGALARLFTKDIKLTVDGPEARKASRRSIHEFGFRSTYELLEKYNALAEERGVLELRYVGTGTIGNRPTFVIVRDLPYEQDPKNYPDARMVLHIDQEWLLPVAVYSYADHSETELLGKYVYTNVRFNPEFRPEAFQF